MPLACPSCGAPLNGNPAEPCEERDLHFPDTSTVEGRRTVWERLAIAAETLSAPQNAHLLTQAARAIAAAEDEIAVLRRAGDRIALHWEARRGGWAEAKVLCCFRCGPIPRERVATDREDEDVMFHNGPPRGGLREGEPESMEFVCGTEVCWTTVIPKPR